VKLIKSTRNVLNLILKSCGLGRFQFNKRKSFSHAKIRFFKLVICEFYPSEKFEVENLGIIELTEISNQHENQPSIRKVKQKQM